MISISARRWKLNDQLHALCHNLLMHHLFVVGFFFFVASFCISKWTPLSRSDLLHRSAKLKSPYVASSLLFLQMNFQEAGTDPFFRDRTVKKVLSNTTWNCGLTCPVDRFNMRETFPAYVGRSPIHAGNVSLILNLSMGHVSPQFHVVFNETFSTVPSLKNGSVPASWKFIFENNRSSNMNNVSLTRQQVCLI